jgi:hypothetical protein
MLGKQHRPIVSGNRPALFSGLNATAAAPSGLNATAAAPSGVNATAAAT